MEWYDPKLLFSRIWILMKFLITNLVTSYFIFFNFKLFSFEPRSFEICSFELCRLLGKIYASVCPSSINFWRSTTPEIRSFPLQKITNMFYFLTHLYFSTWSTNLFYCSWWGSRYVIIWHRTINLMHQLKKRTQTYSKYTNVFWQNIGERIKLFLIRKSLSLWWQ